MKGVEVIVFARRASWIETKSKKNNEDQLRIFSFEDSEEIQIRGNINN